MDEDNLEQYDSSYEDTVISSAKHACLYPAATVGLAVRLGNSIFSPEAQRESLKLPRLVS